MLYYNRISEQLLLITGKEVKTPYVDVRFKVNFSMDLGEKVIENIVSGLFGLIPVVNLFVPAMVRDMKKDEMKSSITSIEQHVMENLNQKVYGVTMMLKEWK